MAIKVLIVEDSPIARSILKRMLDSAPNIEVVGMAETGIQGLELLDKLQPDVICTDLHMPRMNGLEFTMEVMATKPRPILVISASVQEEDTQNVFELLDAGAVDIFPKPRAGGTTEYEAVKQQLINKIQVLSGVRVFTRRRRGDHPPLSSPPIPPPPPTPPPLLRSLEPPTPPLIQTPPPIRRYSALNKPKILTVGASTGGPQALRTVLGSLPSHFPAPVICVQHISEGFLQGLLDWLGHHCHLPIQIAQEGETPRAGVIYFPKEQVHLEFDSVGRFRYSGATRVGGHRPSVTVTFQAVAQVYRAASVGVLLTGMGRDGADGMLAIHQAGGYTIAQNEQSCVVFGMPKEAIALGAAREVLSIEAIPLTLMKVFV
ncbi:chemotaxis-specific protein-glutamate methyltransferase CheB [Spirulina subsalsa FACHB-351]|uniref:Protein-glutamate methylesterase/protein-glutamine glutaminase n=1 Tax=Spirulina subsalsa FACHB-351 TaxID=234711 RepID=A0ABT3L9H8_9CYAN|nr:chemotaxis-specific protein-glutamate methyltransferase CheB [Spirulina subsalsa]MCW6037797.1 chemotaxis-specific protein-glutamate methyltransferase CheB [Spirulina subsalsa FACHB-351]